ncbi:MAG: hypothetical protein U0Z26_13475 [Anaerolineales bacterium]
MTATNAKAKRTASPPARIPFSKWMKLPTDLRTGLTFIGKLKGTAHGWQQALLVHLNNAAPVDCASKLP